MFQIIADHTCNQSGCGVAHEALSCQPMQGTGVGTRHPDARPPSGLCQGLPPDHLGGPPASGLADLLACLPVEPTSLPLAIGATPHERLRWEVWRAVVWKPMFRADAWTLEPQSPPLLTAGRISRPRCPCGCAQGESSGWERGDRVGLNRVLHLGPEPRLTSSAQSEPRSRPDAERTVCPGNRRRVCQR
jgi:hypothetical protein